MELYKRLAELRRERGLTQDELAEEVGVSRQTVSKWERGLISPSGASLIALGRLYGISVDELANGELPHEESVMAVKPLEPEEAKPAKPGGLKIAGTAVVAVLILLIAAASMITIWAAVFRESEEPEEGIIRMGDMEQDAINTFDVETLTQEPIKSLD